MLSIIPTRNTQFEGLTQFFFLRWHCADRSNDEDAVLCVEGDYEAVLESDSLPFAVSSLTEVSAISIDCAAARNISLASMRGITRAQIGRMQTSGQCYSLPTLPSCLKELCVTNVSVYNILTAVERQKGLRSLTIIKPIHDKCTAFQLESLPPEIWSKLKNLEKLTMTSSGLKIFSKIFAEMTALKKLHLSENSELKSLPAVMGTKLQNLEELNLCGCGLKQLPISFSNVTELKILDLSNNSELKSLPEDIGLTLRCLEELNLRECDLQRLPNSISNLTALKKLNLEKNQKLKSLPEDIGSKLSNLEVLKLWECRLQELPPSFSELKALTTLDFGGNNKLQCLPEDIGSKIPNLKELRLWGCGLQHFTLLSVSTSLTILDLGGNNELKSLPEDIGSKIPNLEELRFWKCCLEQLPTSFSKLTALKILDLGGNKKLIRLPEDIGYKLPNLEEVRLWQCGLQQLPPSFSNLTALRILDLGGNYELKCLPEDIGSKLLNLEELRLWKCGLQQFPISCSKLTKLKILDLGGNNKLKRLPEDIGSKLPNLEELKLWECGLQQLPLSFGLPALKILYLDRNFKLKSLPEDIGLELLNLEELRLDHCALQQLPSSFSNLTALKRLHLGGNSELNSLPEDMATKLKSLEELSLWECGLQKLPISFGNLTALKVLHLGKNTILKSLPEDIGTNLQKLEELQLRGCGLQQLPISLSNLTALKKLDLRGNSKLKYLPKDIGSRLQNLEELNLSGCDLQQFPISLSNLTALKKLDLDGNSKLKSLPEDIGKKLKNLEELSLRECGLKQLPISLSNVTALKILNLGGNSKLKSLPEDIGKKLKNLEELNLWGCGLQQLPISLSNVTALKKLNLGGNSELNSLPEDIGKKLKNLEELNLWGCGLQQLPISLSNVTALKKLNLGGNSELNSLPEDIFLELQNLKLLNLWKCGLQQLPMSISNLTALKILDLGENNELKRLPEDMLQNLKNLYELNLRDCGLEELPVKLGFLKTLNVTNCSLRRLPSSIGRLKNLYCLGNPITFPPIGVWQQGLASIRAYFSSEVLTSSRRVKIVVLGESCSGKTSLLQSMLRNASFCTCLEDRTIGVEEYELSLVNKRAKIIECGGQRCYLLTNQLFVSENGLVVIVVDVQRYELTEESFYEHIGKYLQVVYERNENCYVVCVFTKVDLLPNAWNPKLYQEEFKLQMKKFREHRKAVVKENHMWDEEKAAFIRRQNVRVENRLVFTSAKDVETTAKFTDFIDKLTDNEKLFPSAGDIVPETWYNFEERVERECRLSQNSLSALKVDFLNKLGPQFSLSNDEVLIVLRYYHQVGTLLYFHQSRLADVVFGSSKKIVDALKQIFRHNYDVLLYESGTTEISPERFVKDKNELSTNATLSIPLLKALLRGQEFDAESISIFVKMLLSFDFAYVKGEQGLPKEHGDHESYDIVDHLGRTDVCLLVPWLLSQDCPSDAMESFPADCPTNCIEVQLSYSFAFALPLGIFQQFSARCHQISPIIRHWNNGFTLSYGPVKAKFTCKELATNASILCKGRTPKSRNALDRLFHVFWRCIVQLQTLLKTFPGSLYSIFFNHSNGDSKMKEQRVQVSSKDWHLRTLAAAKPRELQACTKSITRGTV